MNSYRKLFNNIVIFAFGTLGSRAIAFVLVPLYTQYLSQAEFGTADLVLVTVNMLFPLVSGSMHEAVIRFAMNKDYDNESVMTNSFIISLVGFIIFLFFYPILKWLNFLDGSLEILYILLLIQGTDTIFKQYTRGIGKSKIFAFAGILTTFLNASFNILFLVVLNMDLMGYYLSFILGYGISALYLVLTVNPLKGISIKKANKGILRKLLSYSLPLIPNSLMWSLINSSSRYFISGFLGVAANGLFAVSSKIPALINIISQVFTQAWQLSAFEEYEKSKDSKFYSRIFDLYFSVLLISTSFIIVVLKPLFATVFAESYFESWQPVPFLVLGTVFSAASGYLGVAYTASNKTRGVFQTSVYGGGISLILNLVLIPSIGIVGAGISSMLSFLSMFLIRYKDTQKYIAVVIKWKKVIIIFVLLTLQIVCLFLGLNMFLEFCINLILSFLIVVVNKNIFVEIFMALVNLRKK